MTDRIPVPANGNETVAAGAPAARSKVARLAILSGQILASALLMAVCVRLVDIDAIRAVLGRSDPRWWLLVILAFAVVLKMGAWKIALLATTCVEAPARSVRQWYYRAWVLDQFIPGGWGSLTLIPFLTRTGLTLTASAGLFALDKVMVVGLELLYALWGLGLVAHRITWRLTLQQGAWVLIGVVFIAVTLVVFRRPLVERSRVCLQALRTRSWPWGRLVAISVARALIQVVGYWAAFRSVGEEISLPVLLGLVYLAGMIGYLPISFQGWGTVEMVAIVVYAPHVSQPASVVAAYLIVRLMIYLLALAIGARELWRGSPA